LTLWGLAWSTLLLAMMACIFAEPEYIAPTPTSSATPTLILTLTPVPTPSLTPTPNVSCPKPDLWAWQTIAADGSYTTTERAAAGRMVCRIERYSCAYYYLVGELDPTIIFKNEESPPFSHEDFRMHPAMLLPLSRLNKLVQEEWGGAVRLRVTDAYDSMLEHNLGQADEDRRISLHFEGRAIDLTTWPIDTARYGRLCTLAHCAGFDWVQNEGDHCHASIRAESLCQRCPN
jgi:hypothetical protein